VPDGGRDHGLKITHWDRRRGRARGPPPGAAVARSSPVARPRPQPAPGSSAASRSRMPKRPKRRAIADERSATEVPDVEALAAGMAQMRGWMESQPGCLGGAHAFSPRTARAWSATRAGRAKEALLATGIDLDALLETPSGEPRPREPFFLTSSPSGPAWAVLALPTRPWRRLADQAPSQLV